MEVNKVRDLLITSAAVSFLAPVAMAGSLAPAASEAVVVTPAPVASAPAVNWGGPFIGAHLGYGWGNTEDINNPAAVAKDLDGILGGIQAGYNVHLPSNIVLGVEASLSFGDISNEWYGRDTKGNDTYYTEDKVGAIGALNARLGYAMGNFMPYVTGGLAIARTRHTLGCDRGLASIPPSGSACANQFETSQSGTFTGWTAGAGVEYALGQNWSLRGEYRYTDIGTNTVTLFDPNYPSSDINDRRFDTHFHTISFGVSYRF